MPVPWVPYFPSFGYITLQNPYTKQMFLEEIWVFGNQLSRPADGLLSVEA